MCYNRSHITGRSSQLGWSRGLVHYYRPGTISVSQIGWFFVGYAQSLTNTNSKVQSVSETDGKPLSLLSFI